MQLICLIISHLELTRHRSAIDSFMPLRMEVSGTLEVPENCRLCFKAFCFYVCKMNADWVGDICVSLHFPTPS